MNRRVKAAAWLGGVFFALFSAVLAVPAEAQVGAKEFVAQAECWDHPGTGPYQFVGEYDSCAACIQTGRDYVRRGAKAFVCLSGTNKIILGVRY
jgi:hypothetical protein